MASDPLLRAAIRVVKANKARDKAISLGLDMSPNWAEYEKANTELWEALDELEKAVNVEDVE